MDINDNVRSDILNHTVKDEKIYGVYLLHIDSSLNHEVVVVPGKEIGFDTSSRVKQLYTLMSTNYRHWFDSLLNNFGRTNRKLAKAEYFRKLRQFNK